MKVSIFFEHILEASEQTGLSITEILQKVHGFGYNAVEINLDYLLSHPQIEKQLNEARLGVSCIYQFYGWDHDSDFSKAQMHVDTAKRLGAKNILVVPGFFGNEETDKFMPLHKRRETFRAMNNSATVQNIVKMLKKTCKHAKNRGVTVTLEDFDSFNSPCSKTYELLYLMKKVPGLKYSFDTGNFAFSNEDALKALCVLKKYVVHIHLKDRGKEEKVENLGMAHNKGLAAVPVGSGYMSIPEEIKFLRCCRKYDGYLAVEHFGSKDQLKFMEESINFLKQFK